MPKEAVARSAQEVDTDVAGTPLREEVVRAVQEFVNIEILIKGKLYRMGEYFDVAVKDSGEIYVFLKTGRMNLVTYLNIAYTLENSRGRKFTCSPANYKGLPCVVVKAA